MDLNEVTSIDKSGEEALSMMVQDGATFMASGVYTKHLLDQLQASRQIGNVSIDDSRNSLQHRRCEAPMLEKAFNALRRES